ncbi:MAG: hypothetical protein A3I78_07680 [Gammaproteobacteria bacterium RIFCSPLOWO2_02_FULL_56_15]|nr:MAG: hypothetical protein A3I78_07680 [Gammaproteobacteria bacterium RIFCSPLOWO2_02_FULL_56_15]
MKVSSFAIAVLSMNLVFATSAMAAETTDSVTGMVLDKCGKLPVTPTIPNGNTASEEDLVSAMKDVKSYQTKVMEYRACLDQIAVGLTAEEDQEKQTLLVSLHNRTVDDEQELGDLFNSSVRAFKGRK